MTEYLKEKPESYDEFFIVFSDYSYIEPSEEQFEFPIIVSTDNIHSKYFDIILNITIRPEFAKSALFYEVNYLSIQNRYNIPYFAVKIKSLPSFLFIFLLYPEDYYFKHKFAKILLPSVSLNFYDIDNNNFLGKYSLPYLYNWFDVCSALSDNKYLTLQTFERLVHNFTSYDLLNYFYNIYF